MTTTYGEKTTCAVCGNSFMYSYLGSTNSMDDPDLDGRPSEMERSTMAFWIHICNRCKYVAPKISNEVEGAKEVVESEEYKKRLNQKGYPKLANLFLCRAMILRHAGELSYSGTACLHAAWVCDDCGLSDYAIECRKLASHDLQQALDLQRERELGSASGGYAETVLVDILRRSGQFDIAGSLCIETITSEGKEALTLKILALQKELIEKKDTGCYTMGAVENEGTDVEPEMTIKLF